LNDSADYSGCRNAILVEAILVDYDVVSMISVCCDLGLLPNAAHRNQPCDGAFSVSDSPASVERKNQRPVPPSLWRFGGLSVWRVALRSVADYRKNQLSARSAQFAYYSMLSLAPLLIVVIAGVAQLPLDGVLESFLRAVDVGMPGNVVDLFEDQVRDIQAKSTTGLIVGAVVLLGIAGSHLFLTMGAGLDAAYGVQDSRHFGRASAVSLALTFGVPFLLLLAMVLLLVGPKLTGPITGMVNLPWVHVLCSAGVRWGVACGFMLLAISVIYWLVPGTKVR
jgi:membrane protein